MEARIDNRWCSACITGGIFIYTFLYRGFVSTEAESHCFVSRTASSPLNI
jgi:hypothetical protein